MPTSFQLDENLNDSDFAEECENESKAANIADFSIRRFPKRLKGKEDDVVLRDLLGKDGTILTKDRGIADDGREGIPDCHPGIIIIANDPSVNTTGNEAVKKILARMKAEISQWPSLSFENSIVEITQVGVEIWKKSDRKTHYLYINKAGWQQEFVEILEINATGR